MRWFACGNARKVSLAADTQAKSAYPQLSWRASDAQQQRQKRPGSDRDNGENLAQAFSDIELLAAADVIESAISEGRKIGTLGIASGQTRASNFRRVKPIDFAALRNGPPLVLPFAGGGAIYSQYDQGAGGPCRPTEDD